MKKAIKRLIVLIIIAVLIMPLVPQSAPISYAADLVEDQQRAVALYTQKFVKEGNERNILLYSQNRKDRIKGYNFEVSSNEYGQFDSKQNNGAPFTNMLVYDSASFVATMYHRTLGMELSANENARDNIYTVESFIKDAEGEEPFGDYAGAGSNNFRFIGGKTEYTQEQLISMADSGQLIPGDLIVYDDETHIMMYLGSGDEIIYEELIIEEVVVEDQSNESGGIADFDDQGVKEGQDITVTVGKDGHYFAHAYNASKNIEVSALELLQYREDSDGDFFLIRPMMTESNGITVKHKVIMDIVWPDSSYSAYTRLGTDPVTGKNNEYYYVGIPTTDAYFSMEDANEGKYVYVGTNDSGTATFKQTGDYAWLVHEAGDVVSWFSGYVGLLFRSWAVGWTDIIETVVSDTIQSVGKVQREIIQTEDENEYAITKDDTLNIEDIIYNRVPLFDANIFNTTTIAGVPIRDRMSDEELAALKERTKLKGEAGVEAREELEEYYNSVLKTMSELELKEMEEKAFEGDENAMERLKEYRNQTNPILVIRQNVASMYLAIRNLAIVGLLLTLIYIGIRMAITTVAEQKGKYKSILVNWCVSLVIVFMIHYIMVFILQLNDALVKMLPKLTEGVSFYETFREMAYELNFMEGWIGTIIYLFLVFFMIKYVWIYIKRFFTLSVLTVAAPVIGIGYAIDKIKDNKSQSLSRWVRNYVFNVIIQFIHAALYTIVMAIVYMLLEAKQTFPAAIFTVVFLNFITQAPKIVQNIFKVDANTLKNTLEDIGTQMAGVATIFGLVKTQANLYGAALKVPGKINEKLFGETFTDAIRYKHNDQVWGYEYDYLGDDEQIREKVKEEEKVREKLERQRAQKIKEDKVRRRAHSQAQMQYARNVMSMSKGLAYAAAAIPTTIISPKAGIAMLVTARNTYKKSKKDMQDQQSKILGYDVDRVKGRFAMKKIFIGATGVAGGVGIVGLVETAKEQIRAESKQFKEANLQREIMNAETENANEIRQLLQEIDEQKHMLQQNGEYTDEAKAKMTMEVETMKTILEGITDGQGKTEIDVVNGKMMVVIPEEIIRAAISDFKRKQKAKIGTDSIGGKHRKELVEYISEYAELKIISSRKFDDMELVLRAEMLNDVIRKMSFSSYREGEGDRDDRYRDPRQSSSLLNNNNLAQKTVNEYVERKVNTSKTVDVNKMAEELHRDIRDQDRLTEGEKQEVIRAIDNEVQDRFDRLNEEQLRTLLAGKTQIEIPDKFKELAARNENLRQMKKELQLSEGRTSVADTDVRTLIDMIQRNS